MEQSAITNKTVFGGCLCKRIQYEVLLPVKWCAHCHCQLCRQHQAAPVVTWFGVEKNNFNLVKGQQNIAWHQSSDKARRGFCIHCGTPLFFEGERWPNEVHITRESTQEDILQKPQLHVFYDRHVNYLDFNDGLDKYGGSDGFTPLLNESAPMDDSSNTLSKKTQHDSENH